MKTHHTVSLSKGSDPFARYQSPAKAREATRKHVISLLGLTPAQWKKIPEDMRERLLAANLAPVLKLSPTLDKERVAQFMAEHDISDSEWDAIPVERQEKMLDGHDAYRAMQGQLDAPHGVPASASRVELKDLVRKLAFELQERITMSASPVTPSEKVLLDEASMIGAD